MRRLSRRGLALCDSCGRNFRAPGGIGSDAAGSLATRTSDLSAGTPSNTATIPRLGSYKTQAYLADRGEFSAVLHSARCFNFRGHARGSIDKCSKLAAFQIPRQKKAACRLRGVFCLEHYRSRPAFQRRLKLPGRSRFRRHPFAARRSRLAQLSTANTDHSKLLTRVTHANCEGPRLHDPR